MDPMEKINEMLARLNELGPEELDELSDLINAEFDRLDGEGNGPATVAAMQKLVEAGTAVQGERAAREQAEAEAAQQADELRKQMAKIRGEGDGDEGDEPAGDPAEDPEDPADPADPADPSDPPADDPADPAADPSGRVPVTAGGTVVEGRVQAMSRNSRGSRKGITAGAGRPKPIHVPATLLAGSGLSGEGGLSAGDPITDKWQLAEAMAAQLRRMHPSDAPHGRTIVASSRWKYPEERYLGRNSYENAKKMDAVAGPQAIMASGGVCAPVNVDYTVPVFSTDERPLKAGLPGFQADRGGVTWVTPPDIAALAGATAVWTEANDVSPTSPTTKPVLTVACGSTQTAYVNAIPTRLKFGNMEGRFAPEQIAANTEYALAAAARIAELELLSLMDAASTLVYGAQYVGATRDILATLDLTCAAYRYRHRIARSTTLTVVFPDWAKDLFRADIARELAHDEDDSNPLAVPDSMIEGYMSARGVNPIWMLDGRPQKTTGGSNATYPAQQFGTQSAGAVSSWPNNGTLVQLVWNIFVEGTMQLLDGGQLDLGIVRDSTLDATNDYETFVEPFEGIAFRGVEALTVISNIVPNGASAGTIAPSSTLVN